MREAGHNFNILPLTRLSFLNLTLNINHHYYFPSTTNSAVLGTAPHVNRAGIADKGRTTCLSRLCCPWRLARWASGWLDCVGEGDISVLPPTDYRSMRRRVALGPCRELSHKITHVGSNPSFNASVAVSLPPSTRRHDSTTKSRLKKEWQKTEERGDPAKRTSGGVWVRLLLTHS